jgi:hypothetical protein
VTGQFGDGVTSDAVLGPGGDPSQLPAPVAVLPGGVAGGVGARSPVTALSGPIGALDVQPQADPLPVGNEAGVPIGVIGLPGSDEGKGNRGRRRGKATPAGEEPVVKLTTVSGAGVAIGRAEARQPASPPAVAPVTGTAQATRSRPLNTDLVPATAPASPGTVAGSAGPLASAGGEPGGPGIPVDGQAGRALGSEAGAPGPEGEPMTMMPGMGAGGGQRDQDRQRLAYLPQDEEYWGTDTSGAVAPIGMRDVSDPPEQDFESSPALARIGAGNGTGTNGQARPDRRNP